MIGVDEFIIQQEERLYSVRINSDKATFMFIKSKDFQERILKPYPSLYKELVA